MMETFHSHLPPPSFTCGFGELQSNLPYLVYISLSSLICHVWKDWLRFSVWNRNCWANIVRLWKVCFLSILFRYIVNLSLCLRFEFFYFLLTGTLSDRKQFFINVLEHQFQMHSLQSLCIPTSCLFLHVILMQKNNAKCTWNYQIYHVILRKTTMPVTPKMSVFSCFSFVW